MIKSMRKIEAFRKDALCELKWSVNEFMAKVASKNPRCVGYATEVRSSLKATFYSAIVEYDA